MSERDHNDFAFDTKVIIRRQSEVVSILRGNDAMAFLAGLPDGEADRKAYIAQYIQQYLVNMWLTICRSSPLLRHSQMAPMDRCSFHQCLSVEELREQLVQTGGSEAKAYYLGSLCFFPQNTAQDAWLVIRDWLPFEIICCRRMIANGDFETWLRRVTAATDAQLKTLKY